MSDDKRCTCYARMAGECMCGAWDNAADDERAALLQRVEELEGALTKISAIRDSIVGCQGFNFSEHAYPLVAVLDAAGFKGAGYEIARANLGTLIDQRNAAEAERDALREQVERLTKERDDDRRLHEELAASYHATARKTCSSLASQLSAVKAARDEACDALDGLSDESIELEQRVRIAELRKVGD